MPQGAPRGEGLGARQTAARHGHLGEGRRIDGRAVPIDEEKRAVGLPFDALHVDPRAQFHAEALQLREQRADHGVRLLRSREDASFGLDAQGHTERFPPLHQRRGRSGAQQAIHQARSAGIDGGCVVDVGKGVGHVAATAACGAHFGERGGAALENHDGVVRQVLFESERQHATGRAAAENGCGHGEKRGKGGKEKRRMERGEKKAGTFCAKHVEFCPKRPYF